MDRVSSAQALVARAPIGRWGLTADFIDAHFSSVPESTERAVSMRVRARAARPRCASLSFCFSVSWDMGTWCPSSTKTGS